MSCSFSSLNSSESNVFTFNCRAGNFIHVFFFASELLRTKILFFVLELTKRLLYNMSHSIFMYSRMEVSTINHIIVVNVLLSDVLLTCQLH